MKIELWDTARPAPYEGNPRKISDAAVAKVAASIREFGFRQPIVVDDDGVVLVGHARLLAARSLGLDTVPVHVAKGLSPVQARAYRLADNRTNEEAAWDFELLAGEIDALDDFDLELTGFDPAELDDIRERGAPVEGEDDVPPEPETPTTITGDVWACGGHRLLCGDATEADDVARALDGAEPLVMVTDPPYGVEYDPAWRNKVAAAGLIGQKNATRAIGQVSNDDRADWRAAWALFPGPVLYVWHGAGDKGRIVAESIEAAGFVIRSQIIWYKHRHVISRGHYHGRHEPCFYAVRKGGKANWQGGHSQTTVWQVAHARSETGHGTQKPVEVMRRPILNHTAEGDAVYDPFIGSGTTMIAAEATARRCIGIDIDPVYVDVAVQRWQAFTGQAATLDGDGRTFGDIADERRRTGDRATGAAAAG